MTNTTQNATWGAGESGFYDFDANGNPAVGADRLQYNQFENKFEQSAFNNGSKPNLWAG